MRGVHSNKRDHQSIFDVPPTTEIANYVRPKSDGGRWHPLAAAPALNAAGSDAEPM